MRSRLGNVHAGRRSSSERERSPVRRMTFEGAQLAGGAPQTVNHTAGRQTASIPSTRYSHPIGGERRQFSIDLADVPHRRGSGLTRRPLARPFRHQLARPRSGGRATAARIRCRCCFCFS